MAFSAEGPRPALVVGLGNPGVRYAETRHNVGFAVVAELARRRGLVLSADECSAAIARGENSWLVQPQTYMNRSGATVRCLVERFAFQPASMLVVYDEVHLPLGKLRLRREGSPAGHRGLESILEALGTSEVARLRLGVGVEGMPGGSELPDFVLSPFAAAEREAVAEMVRRAADACECWLAEGIGVAMSRFNG